MDHADPTRRFSDRVEHYLRYRPRYPVEVLDILRAACGLKRGWVVADVGSGTGFLSDLFLRNGNRVFGGRDGSWHPTWSRGDAFPETWPVAKREWQGILTLDALKAPRDFGSIGE